MLEAVLAILLAIASSLAALFWRRASDAAESSRMDVQRLRDAAQAKQAERTQAIAQAVTEQEDRLEALGQSKQDRQALADLLNGDS